MSSTSRRSRAPRRVRQPLAQHEAGAHMYAPFWGHVKAGLASMVPFALIYFTAQPIEEAMSFLTAGGFTIAPSLIAIYACGWAGLSMALLHALRFNQAVATHYAAYALGGAVALLAVAMGLLALVRLATVGTADFWNASTFTMLLLASPPLGALGAAIGRRVLAFSIQWYRWLEREPLPDALRFVDGKRDRDEYKRS